MNKFLLFTRTELASILGCTTRTIYNREKDNKYPEPSRDISGKRIYTIDDVFDLQLKTYNFIHTRPVVEMLYEKGFTSATEVGKIIDEALSKKRGTV